MSPSRIPQPRGSPLGPSPLSNTTNLPSSSAARSVSDPTSTSSGGNGNNGFKNNNPFVHRLGPGGIGGGSPASLLPKTPSTPPLHIQPRGKENTNATRFSPRQTPPHLHHQLKERNISSPSPSPQQQRIPSPSGRGQGQAQGPGQGQGSKLGGVSPGRGSTLSPNAASGGGGQGGQGGGQQKVRKIPSGLTRRPVPSLSPDLRGSPTSSGGGGKGGLMRKISMGGPGGNTGGGGNNGNNKSCLRPQPSVPVLRSEQAETRAREELAANRKRANSSGAGLAPAAHITGSTSGIPAPNPAHTTRFAAEIDSIPPPPTNLGVPQHIRLRLRLLSHLARTLEVDQSDLAKRIDIPGLLARVDQAYEKRQGTSDDRREVGTTVVPMPEAPVAVEKGDERWWMFPDDDAGVGSPLGGTGGGGNGLKSSASLTSLGLGGGLTSSFSLSNIGLGLGLGRDKEKDRVEKSGIGEKRAGMLGRLKMFGRKSMDERDRQIVAVIDNEDAYDRVWHVPIFGVSLVDIPPDGWCVTKVGGQDHELPIPVFILVEEIYRRGMDVPGIFRLAGKEAEVTKHYDACNTPPFYGDGTDLSSPNVHSLSNVLKRFMRDLPEPILDDSLFSALWDLCCAPDFPAGSMNCQRMDIPTPSRLSAAITILKMLPPPHFSLLVYSLAFVTQLQFFPGNRLTLDAISIIFGPALLASRAKGVPGLGPGSKGKKHDPEVVSAVVDQSQKALGWLVRNWPEISKQILEAPFPSTHGSSAADSPASIDPRLLSPIDMRLAGGLGGGKNDSPFAIAAAATGSRSLDIDRSSFIPTWDLGHVVPLAGAGEDKPKEKPKMPGLLRSALSSRNLSGSYREKEEKEKAPKRSASFNSLSSIFKKGMGSNHKATQPSPTLTDASDLIRTPSLSRDRASSPTPSLSTASISLSLGGLANGTGKSAINPQIASVLGSLQDLLLGKDRQIERDARELALLRHTLLEMDEKLQKSLALSQPKPAASALDTTTSANTAANAAASASSADSSTAPTSASTPLSPGPLIKITASPSVVSMNDTLLADLQNQLSTALSALTQSRETTRQKDRQLVDLHTALARQESIKKVEMGKLEVALAMETARCKGLREERDLARERLDKVKKELFAVN